MPATLSPILAEDPYRTDAENAELLAAMDAVGADFGTVKYAHLDCAMHQVYQGRRVVVIPGRHWPTTPDLCTDDGPGEWLFDEQVLVCRGCGIDAT